MAMTRSTFAGFTTATLALAASQRALDVTGQNISNINTDGYTRQRLDLASISPTGHGYFQTQTDCRVGQGVEMTGIIRIRDPFIDIQYRTQLAKVGTIDAQDAALSKVGNIFDETDKEAVRAALNAVVTQLEKMSQSDSSNQGASDTAVRSSIEVLLNTIHENGKKIYDVQEETVGELQKTTIPDLNEYLEKIKVLNQSIKNTQILGGAALELQDQRDSLIDELATYLPIDVSYKDMNLGGGIKVDTLQISFTDTQGNKYMLVDDDKIGSFSMDPVEPENYVPVTISIEPVAFQQKGGVMIPNPNTKTPDGFTGTVYETYDDAIEAIKNAATGDPDQAVADALRAGTVYFKNPRTFDIAGKVDGGANVADSTFNNFGEGVLKGKVDALNKSGGFDYPPTDFKGIGFYIKMYDSFVNQFASTLNQLNIDAGGKPLFTRNDGTVPDASKGEQFTANDIKVSDDWILGDTKIMTKDQMSDADTANENVLAMIDALTNKVYKFGYTPVDADGNPIQDPDDPNKNAWVTVFEGKMFDGYDNLQGTQSIDRKSTQSILSTRMGVLNDISDSKDSVSGVWMDEEVMNLMRFQQSYNAAARLMTTLDEAIETLINNTGRVGR